MSKSNQPSIKRQLKSIVAVTFLALTAAWLYFGNLGCLAEQLVDGGQVVLEPHRLELTPNTTKTSVAKVTWDAEDLYATSWTLGGSGIEAVSAATISPASGYQATVSITGADYESVYNPGTFSFSSYNSYDIPVTARFAQPFLSAVGGNDVSVTRGAYLSLYTANPQLELTIPAYQPLVRAESGLLNGLSSVRGLILGVKAEMKNAPIDWRYQFKFSLRVHADWDGGDRWTVHLNPSDIPTQTDPAGKWASYRFNDLNLGMDDLLNDSYWGLNAKFGHYFLYFDVEVTQVGLDKSFYASEMSKYPFYIGSLN
jgi:hypothetical protein